jgi:hypothetical protein
MNTFRCVFWTFAMSLAVLFGPLESSYGAPQVGVGGYSAKTQRSGVVQSTCYYGNCGYYGYPRYRRYYGGGYYRPYRRYYGGYDGYYRPYRPYRGYYRGYSRYPYYRRYYRSYRRHW